jgi:hypothetical protein
MFLNNRINDWPDVKMTLYLNFAIMQDYLQRNVNTMVEPMGAEV